MIPVSRIWLSLCFVSLFCFSSLQSQSLPSSEETAVRAVAERFYQAWAAKVFDGWLRLWSTHAAGLDTHKKNAQELFASSVNITLKDLTVRRVVLRGKQAWVRVEIDAQVIDAQTGKEKPGYGKTIFILLI